MFILHAEHVMLYSIYRLDTVAHTEKLCSELDTMYSCMCAVSRKKSVKIYRPGFFAWLCNAFNGGPTAECVKLYNGKRSSSKSSFCAKSLFTSFKNAPAENLLILFIIKNHLAFSVRKKFALGEKLFLRKVGIAQQDAPFMEGRTFEMYEIQEKLDDYNSIMLVCVCVCVCKKRYANVSRCCLPLGMKTLSHSNNGEQWRSSRRSHAYRKPLSASRSAWLNN
ncbi:hypothetical protein Tsp_12942 [Trichinella spiralis]|uniref:hypothetical protein n=1 Tax=Trichinella spiralis TaxID=6334 RepID=UPI0001EFD825|nr:hypothetical protein Tsp_12942 [Trichinella spiralis]